MTNNYKMDTLAIHAGQESDPMTGAVMPPIYQAATFAQLDVGENQGYIYSRVNNPTRTVLENNLAVLEQAKYALAFGSGMAATTTVMQLLNPGDHVVIGDDVYGGTFRLVDNVLKSNNIDVTFVDLTNLDAFQAAINPATRLVWLETPSNPNLKLADIAALSEIAHAHNLVVAVDNTFASPYLQQPLTLGADIVMHSATKYLGGHSDVILGVLMLNDPDLYEQLHLRQYTMGAIPGPQDCWLVLRGVKTLALRMERHCQNATALAQWLANQPEIEEVIYPGLPNHPQHELAKRQMRGFGGMISIILQGGEIAARKMAKQTRLFTLAVSLGGVESLIEVPIGMTHASSAESSIAVNPALVRLSVGIEHIDDLQTDLAMSLANL